MGNLIHGERKVATIHCMNLYLDHNATTPLLPEAWDAMQKVLREPIGNPSSPHQAGRRARQLLEDARDELASLLNAKSEEVIFTSGATEGNNLAIHGLAGAGDLLASKIEHPCVIEPLKQLQAKGRKLDWVPVQPDGRIDAGELLNRVSDATSLVCLMLANHVTGAIEPVREVAERLTVPIHCDAAQAVGKIVVDFKSLGVSTLTFSGHKFGGPVGIGGLLLKAGTKFTPLQHGGHQQRGQRPGTEPIALAVGMVAALRESLNNLESKQNQMSQLAARFQAKLETLDRIHLNGPSSDRNRLPHTFNISFLGCRADILLVSLDLAGVACSTGSACSSGSLLPSPVLEAMQVGEERLRSAMRFSLHHSMSEADIDAAAETIIRCVKAMRT